MRKAQPEHSGRRQGCYRLGGLTLHRARLAPARQRTEFHDSCRRRGCRIKRELEQRQRCPPTTLLSQAALHRWRARPPSTLRPLRRAMGSSACRMAWTTLSPPLDMGNVGTNSAGVADRRRGCATVPNGFGSHRSPACSSSPHMCRRFGHPEDNPARTGGWRFRRRARVSR
jgi:hypothetical protein